ncbi:MAG: hypothetical protein Q4D38_08265 [Planctomycetia bacterium]|nr:hypothetical protein [Planctomycetia bacterium]
MDPKSNGNERTFSRELDELTFLDFEAFRREHETHSPTTAGASDASKLFRVEKEEPAADEVVRHRATGRGLSADTQEMRLPTPGRRLQSLINQVSAAALSSSDLNNDFSDAAPPTSPKGKVAEECTHTPQRDSARRHAEKVGALLSELESLDESKSSIKLEFEQGFEPAGFESSQTADPICDSRLGVDPNLETNFVTNFVTDESRTEHCEINDSIAAPISTLEEGLRSENFADFATEDASHEAEERFEETIDESQQVPRLDAHFSETLVTETLETPPERDSEGTSPNDASGDPLSNSETQPRAFKAFLSVCASSRLFWVETTFGALLGILVVVAIWDWNHPVENRILELWSAASGSNYQAESVQSDWLRTTLVYHDVSMEPTQSKNAREAQAEEIRVTLPATARFSRHPIPTSVSMKGVCLEQPVWGVGESDNVREIGGTRPLTPLFSHSAEKKIETQLDNLASLAYLESVKGEYLPQYEEKSKKIKTLQEEAQTIKVALYELLGVSEITEESLRSPAAKNDNVVGKIERLADIRKELQEIQREWIVMNTEVMQKLQKIQPFIATDGKAFSELLRYTRPDEKSVCDFFCSWETQRRIDSVAEWSGSLARMVQTGLLDGCASLDTTGEIEIFGQTFGFEARWTPTLGEKKGFSGSLRLTSDEIPEELMMDSFVTIVCSIDKNGVQRHVSARIPTQNDLGIWGDPLRLALSTNAHDGVTTVDLTFVETPRGKAQRENPEEETCALGASGTLVMEFSGLSYGEMLGNESYKSVFEGKASLVAPERIVVSAQVAGECAAPELKIECDWTKSFLQSLVETTHGIHQKKREELIASIYERLKNAETTFNSIVEPYYREMMACVEDTQLFRTMLQTARDGVKRQAAEQKPTASVEIAQVEDEMGIPMFNPDLGKVDPVPLASAPQVGAETSIPPAPQPTSHMKQVPVKKVSSIPLPATIPTEGAPAAAVPKAAPHVEIAPMDASVFDNHTSSQGGLPPVSPAAPAAPPAESGRVSISEEIPAPAVAPPVLYSSKTSNPTAAAPGVSPRVPSATSSAAEPALESAPQENPLVEIPISKPQKRQQPLPMMRSTTNYGS